MTRNEELASLRACRKVELRAQAAAVNRQLREFGCATLTDQELEFCSLGQLRSIVEHAQGTLEFLRTR